MTDSKISIYDLRKNVLENITSNKFITAKTKTSLLKQYNDAFINVDKKGNVYKRTVQSQRTQLNKINDKLKEFDIKAPTLQKVNIKIKEEKKEEESKKIDLVEEFKKIDLVENSKKIVLEKKTKKNEYNVEESINTPQMLTTFFRKGEAMQTSKSFTRDINNIFNILKIYDGKSIIIRYIIGGAVTFEREYNETFSPSMTDFYTTSGSTIFWANDYEGDITISYSVMVIKKNNPQFFADGINHCVFYPILKWAENKKENAKSEKTQYNYDLKINKINEFIEEFKVGLPDKKDIINKVCNDLQINLNIETPFQNNIIECKSTVKGMKTFNLINTRINHVDYNINEVVNLDDFIKVSYEELLKLKEQYDIDGTYYQYRKNSKIYSINTLYNTYICGTEFSELKKNFLNANGLNNCMVDDITDKELSNFISHGTHYNNIKDYVNKDYLENIACGSIDMEKAYLQSELSLFYEGFLGKITDFRKCNKIMGLGYYCIDNLDFSECDKKFLFHVEKLRAYNNNIVYGSPELKMLSSYGIKYNIICGCWGVVPLHLKFEDEMIKGREINMVNGVLKKGITHYAKLFGSLDMHYTEEQIWMKGTKEYFESMSFHSNLECKYLSNDEGYFIKNKMHNYHLGHVTGFITMYNRLNVIEQLMAMDETKILRVCCDGVYYTEHEFECKNAFRIKDGEAGLRSFEAPTYISMYKEYDIGCMAENRDNYEISLFKGVGGSGKTHINIHDEGLIKVLYVVTSWKLSNEKKKENTKIKCDVMANLLSDPEKTQYWLKYYNVLIIDECSMISNERKDAIIKTYKGCKIIFCGDPKYQLDFIEEKKNKIICKDTPFNEEGINFIKTFTYSHRCQCEELRDFSNLLRDMIDKNINFEYVKDEIIKIFKKKRLTITRGRFLDNYGLNDTVLCWRKETVKEYTNLFRGRVSEKYVVIDNKKLGKNKGDIIITKDEFNIEGCNNDGLYYGKIEGYNVVIKHAFTVHSVQGITCKNKVYIDINDIKDLQMLYTAVSRSEYFNKIKLII